MLWDRARGVWKSKHFSAKEFECHDGICVRQFINDNLINLLDAVRDEVGLPVKVTSGFRCDKHQETLRNQGYETATGRSSHQDGNAADISCSDMKKLEDACLKVFAKYSVGVARSFIHVDIRAGGPRRWTYK